MYFVVLGSSPFLFGGQSMSIRDKFEMCPVCGGRVDFAYADEPCGKCKKKAWKLKEDGV